MDGQCQAWRRGQADGGLWTRMTDTDGHGRLRCRWAVAGRLDREAWRAAVHGAAKSWIWLSDWTELNLCWDLGANGWLPGEEQALRSGQQHGMSVRYYLVLDTRLGEIQGPSHGTCPALSRLGRRDLHKQSPLISDHPQHLPTTEQ